MSTILIVFFAGTWLVNAFFVMALLQTGPETRLDYAIRIALSLMWPMWMLPFSVFLTLTGRR